MLVKSQNFNAAWVKYFAGQCLARVKNSAIALMKQNAQLALFALLVLPLSAMANDALVSSYGDTPNTAPNTTIVTYSMVVDNGNNGGVAATGVVANATVPAGMTFVSATPSVGTCSFVAPNVVCPLGNILGSLNTGVAATIAVSYTHLDVYKRQDY